MEFISWFLIHFGLFFGPVFLMYLFLMIRRMTVLYDFLRHVPAGEGQTPITPSSSKALVFLDPFFDRLEQAAAKGNKHIDILVDAIWAEIDCRVTVHFQAISGYVSTLVLIGFAGTIFGSIGAFNEMFQGIAAGEAAAEVFADAWNKGLSTALYTSLGAAAMGGVVLSLIGSRFLLTRARRLETMAGLRIWQILGEEENK
ncbi:MAG: hypothetical protein MI892_30420 [Desulfobacterales bacterium]|nr:hypothetical protein [Desulfobacterales bacterium]